MSSSIASPPQILVVDDNPATRYSTARVLRAAGLTVIEAETGLQALELAQQGVDLIVLDVHLPDIDGFEVCRRLRERKETVRLPVLHLSATFVKDTHKVHGLESGADGYLTHPIEPPVLIATVHAFLRTRQAEIDLRQSENRFKAIFENAPNGVAVFDDRLTFVNANPTICLLFQRSREQIVGSTLQQIVPAADREVVAAMELDVRSNRPWRGILPLDRPGGERLQLDWNVSRLDDVRLRLAIVSDISDRLKFEHEREQLLISERSARTDAERANRLKDEFLATLSHELRTPLNSIVGWSQLLRMGHLKAEETEQGLEAIERNAMAQAQMISDLLDVSRITSGKIRLEVQTLDPAELIDGALSTVSLAAGSKSIRLTKTLDPNAGLISGDPTRLQQVLWNLVNNAVKFTPKAGRIHVILQRIDSHIEIRVSDTGSGIDPAQLNTIFERFSQEDASSTREHGGLGLGLAIARQLVEMHGGTISAESPGKQQGATFIIRLPILAARTLARDAGNLELYVSPGGQSAVASADAGLARSGMVKPSIDLVGIRVLVVEDDPDSRYLLKRIISAMGAETAETASAAEALDVLESFDPHVLISDLGMPGRDGFHLIHDIRARGYSFQKLPAVALTAFARIEDRRRALLAGFQVHLSKPVDPWELGAVIASLVGRTEAK